MFMRKWLLSSVVFGGVVMGAAPLALSDSTAAETVYRPNSSWAVSKIAARESGGDSYCALARRFTDGVVLTMARNAKDESSLAIDFQKMQLNKAQAYAVSADAGFGQARRFDVRPVSGKALVLHLGQDYAFYDALNRSDRLTVDVNGQDYAFFMGDIAGGQKKLNGCLATLIEPAAGDEGAQTAQAPAASGQTPALSVSNAPVNEAQLAEMASLRRENERLKADIQAARESYESAMAKNSAESESVAAMNRTIRGLETERDALNDKLADMRSRMEIQNSAQEQDSAYIEQTLKAEIATERTKNETLLHELAQQKALAADLQQKMAAAGDRSREESLIATLKDRIAALETQNTALRSDYDAQMQRVASLEAQLKTQMAAQDDARREAAVNVSAAQRAADEKIAAAARDAEARISTAMRESEMKLSALAKENQALRDDLNVASDHSQEMTRISELEAENIKLMAEVSDAADRSQENERIATLEAENHRLLNDSARQQHDIRTLQAQLDGAKHEAQKGTLQDEGTIAALNKRIRAIQGEKEALERDLEKQMLQVADLKARLQNDTALTQGDAQRVAGLEQENESLNQKLVRQTQEIAALQSRLSDVGERSRVADDAAQKEDMQKIASLMETVEQLEGRNAALLAQLDEVSSSPAPVAADSYSALARVKILEEQLQMANVEKNKLAQKLDALRTEKADGIFELASSNWDLEEATRRFNEAERELQKMGGQVEAQRAQCTAEKRELEFMLFDPEIASEAQTAKLMSLEKELVAARADVARSKQALEARVQDAPPAGDIEALRSKVARLESEKARLEQENETLQLAQKVQHVSPSSGEALAPSYADERAGIVVAETVNWNDAPSVSAGIEAEADISSSTMMPGEVSRPVSLAAAVTEEPLSASSLPLNEASTITFKPAGADLQALLEQASVVRGAAVKPVDAGEDAAVTVYSWDAENLFGSAEQKALGDIQQFDTLVEAYLNKTENRCPGDFAAMPDVVKDQDGIRISTYEVACMGDDASAAASLVFYTQDGVFTSIAHEVDVASMDVAMDVSERLVHALLSTP